MGEWFAQWPAFIATFALLILPGLPAAVLVRLRGTLRLGIAIVTSVAIIAAASIIAPLIGMRWSWFVVGVIALVVTAVAALIRVLTRHQTSPRHVKAPSVAWLAISVALVGWIVVLTFAIAEPSHPSQLYDGIFHINAVEYIAQTGNASPFAMTMAYPGRSSIFYPTGWHAIVSLVMPLTGSAVVATNVVTVSLIALAWPAGISFLASALFPSRQGAAIWAPLVTFGFGVFPIGFLNWGVLYPNLLGDLMLPMFLGLVILACRSGLSVGDRILVALLALAAAGATALGHPSALLAGIALLIPFALWQTWRAWRVTGTRQRTAIACCVIIGLVVLVAVWRMANVTTDEWLPGGTLAHAVGEVVFLSPAGRASGLLLGPLVAFGIWRVVKDRQWWILWTYGVSVFFFLVSTWMPILWLRSALVGIWYDDTTRVAALLGITGLPLAALGASTVFAYLLRLHRQRRAIATTLIILVAIAATTHLIAIRDDLRFARNVAFRFDESSQGLTPDEVALFEEAESIVGDDEVVVGDPLTGAAFFLAYSGQQVVFPHAGGSYGEDARILAQGLADGGESVCLAADRLGVKYAFDFGDRVMFENFGYSFEGLHDLENAADLTEVARVGDAALFELSGCRP